jgi:hypothetical protein
LLALAYRIEVIEMATTIPAVTDDLYRKAISFRNKMVGLSEIRNLPYSDWF